VRYKFSELIEEVQRYNSELRYGLNDIVGVTIEKGLIPTVANLTQTALDKFYLVEPNTFVYNPRTHGVRLGMGYNQTDKTYITSWNNFAFRVKQDMLSVLNPEYLWMYFNRRDWDRETNFRAWGSSTIVFSWNIFREMTIDLPSKEYQDRIVKQYAVITNRIGLLKQINDNLEATAQAIYKETVLRADSEKQDSIYSILSVINGSPFSSEMFNSEKRGYPLVRIRDLSKCDPDIYTDEMINKMEYVNVGDILIGMDGEFIPHIWYGHKGVLNQRVCKVIPTRDTVHPLFLYLTLKPILAEVQRTQGGTTVIHIGKKDFDRMVCVSLTEEEHVAFSRKVLPLYNRMLENYQEMLLLSQMQTDILSLLSH